MRYSVMVGGTLHQSGLELPICESVLVNAENQDRAERAAINRFIIEHPFASMEIKAERVSWEVSQ